MSLANLRLHGDAVVAKLTAAGLVVGDGTAPTEAYGLRPDKSFIPWVVVYPVPGTFDGTLEDPWDDADLVYQVTCVGDTRASAVGVEDKVNAALLPPGALTVTGRVVQQVRLDIGGGVRRDDTAKPPVFISTPRFRVVSTPA